MQENSVREDTSPAEKKREEKETLTYESPIFTGGGEEFLPEETRTEGEKKYRLVSTRIRNAKKTGEMTYAQVTIPYDLEGDDTVPETADVPLIDEESGTEFERELSLVDVEEISREWSDTFSFSVTPRAWSRLTIWGQEIPGMRILLTTEKNFWISPDCPGALQTARRGRENPVKMGGRGGYAENAAAVGSKLVRNVKAKYGGQIRTPDLEGKQYIGIYEEVLPETEDEIGIEPEPEIMSQPETIPDTSEETVQASLAERDH